MLWTIENRTSGLILGTYEGESAQDAYLALCRDANAVPASQVPEDLDIRPVKE